MGKKFTRRKSPDLGRPLLESSRVGDALHMKLISALLIPFIVISHQLARIYIFPIIERNQQPIELLPFLNLVEVWNRGISFGMFGDLDSAQYVLAGVALTITLILSFCLIKVKDTVTIAALCLMIGGALGNVADRLRFGGVADYIDLHIFGYHWPAFNFTDSAIFLGAALLIWQNLKSPDAGVN